MHTNDPHPGRPDGFDSLTYAALSSRDGDSPWWIPAPLTSVQVKVLGYSPQTPWDALALDVGTYEFATREHGLLCLRGFLYCSEPFYALNLRVTGLFRLTYLGLHHVTVYTHIPYYLATDFENGAHHV